MITMETVLRGAKKGINTTLELAKTIVPIYFIITFLNHTPIMLWISHLFSPLMGLLGLPGEASVVLALGYWFNLYGAVGAIMTLNLSVQQITNLGLMLTISHNLLLETAITKRMGAPTWLTMSLRIGMSLLTGIVFNALLSLIL